MALFVGIDWGNTDHAVCVEDAQGRVQMTFTVLHTEEGITQLCTKLLALGPVSDFSLAIECRNGLLIDRLLSHRFTVFGLHPNAVKACRSRYTAAQGKSDPTDAYILADVLRTDGHRFDPIKPSSDALKALRGIVHERDRILEARLSLLNQLSAVLLGFWPGAVGLFSSLDSAISLAFLEQFVVKTQTPTAARLAAFFKRHGYSGGKTPAELLSKLGSAAKGGCGPAELAACTEQVSCQVAILKTINVQLTRLAKLIEKCVPEHPDGLVFMSLPGAGKLTAGQLLAELGDVPGVFADADHLAAVGGVTPVTRASGKVTHGKKKGRPKGTASFRHACNHRLRKFLTQFADNSRRQCPWAAQLYDDAIARGHKHPHALRIVARAWTRILWRMWRDKKPYDEKLRPPRSTTPPEAKAKPSRRVA